MREHQRIFYRRRLPHYEPPKETFHVTFRLAGSLPREAIIRLKQEREEFKNSLQRISSPAEQKRLRREWGGRYFNRFEEYLDRMADDVFWLSEDSTAAKVAEIIHAQDGKDHDLLAYCLMPNHVHLLATCWQRQPNSAAPVVKRSSDRFGPTTEQLRSTDEQTEVRFAGGRTPASTGFFLSFSLYSSIVQSLSLENPIVNASVRTASQPHTC